MTIQFTNTLTFQFQNVMAVCFFQLNYGGFTVFEIHHIVFIFYSNSQRFWKHRASYMVNRLPLSRGDSLSLSRTITVTGGGQWQCGQAVELLSLICLHPTSMLQREHSDFSLSSNLATQIKGQKNKPPAEQRLPVFDDESTHSQMCCRLNIAYNQAISNCRIHSYYIFHNENIFFQCLDWSPFCTASFVSSVFFQWCSPFIYVIFTFQTMTNVATPHVTVWYIK